MNMKNIIKFPPRQQKHKHSETAKLFRRLEAMRNAMDHRLELLREMQMEFDYRVMDLEKRGEKPDSLTKFVIRTLSATEREWENSVSNLSERLTEIWQAWADLLERKLGGDK